MPGSLAPASSRPGVERRMMRGLILLSGRSFRHLANVDGCVASAPPLLETMLFRAGSTAPGLAFGGVLVDVLPPFKVGGFHWSP